MEAKQEPAATPAPTDDINVPPHLAELIDDWQAKAAAGQPIEVELEAPVRFGQEVVERLTFRPLELGDMRKFPLHREQLTFDHYATAGGKMCGRPPVFMDKLSAPDGTTMVLVVELFWRASRRTGGK